MLNACGNNQSFQSTLLITTWAVGEVHIIDEGQSGDRNIHHSIYHNKFLYCQSKQIGSIGKGQAMLPFNSLRPRQNGRHFTDVIFKCIFLNENVWISIKISLKFVPKGPINNIPALVQIMAWRRPGDKPLSDPMVVRSTTHICVTRPQWVKAPSSKLSLSWKMPQNIFLAS